MTRGETGLPLLEVTQSDPKACMSACIVAMTPELVEDDVTRVLAENDLYAVGVGVGLHSARKLDVSLGKIGLRVRSLYDARGTGENEDAYVADRLALIDEAVIRDGKKVLVTYPRRREGKAPFQHFSVIGEDPEHKGKLIVMDPSEIDGGTRHPQGNEILEYVTPEEYVPVMAWTIQGSEVREVATAQVTPSLPEDNEAMDTLLTNPIWLPDQVGIAIPLGTQHPTSVGMTTTDISDQFERFGGVVLSRDGKIPVGYPRFVVPPQIEELSLDQTGKFGNLPFPTQQAAEVSGHMERTYEQLYTAEGGRADITEKNGLFWLPGVEFNVKSWQNNGLGISSRQAQAHLEGRPDNNIDEGDKAKAQIKAVIAEHSGAKEHDIYLFPTGMSAIYWLNQALIKAKDSAPAVQFGFPYVDTYDQRMQGPHRSTAKNMLDFLDQDYDRLRDLLAADKSLKLRGVITEFPSNPLLATTDYDRLATVLDGRAPIIIDDTVGTMYNLDDSKLPDAVVARVTSLTKFFSGRGNVMGGSIVLRPESPDYEQVKAALDDLYQDTLWHEDARVLANNSTEFSEIMPEINQNGLEIAQWLQEEMTGEGRALEAVYHPSVVGTREFDAVKKDGRGYSGLMTLRFNDPEQAFRFFDRVYVNKGPGLGLRYTLGCLYTLLAHKRMLSGSIKKHGVTTDLVRLSVGIEPDIQARLDEAFKASKRK